MKFCEVAGTPKVSTCSPWKTRNSQLDTEQGNIGYASQGRCRLVAKGHTQEEMHEL
jgi:hypothetical protein